MKPSKCPDCGNRHLIRFVGISTATSEKAYRCPVCLCEFDIRGTISSQAGPNDETSQMKGKEFDVVDKG